MKHVIDRLEDIASLHRKRGAHRDCQVHGVFDPDCWFCGVSAIEDALKLIRDLRSIARTVTNTFACVARSKRDVGAICQFHKDIDALMGPHR